MARFRTQVTEGASPLQTLGGLFHDVVYYQPDGGLTQAQWELVNSPTRAIDVHDDDRVTVGASAGGALDGEGGAAGAHSAADIAAMAGDDDMDVDGGGAGGGAGGDVAMDGAAEGTPHAEMRARVQRVLEASGYGDKRAAKMTQDDVLTLLAAFNNSGIHFT